MLALNNPGIQEPILILNPNPELAKAKISNSSSF